MLIGLLRRAMQRRKLARLLGAARRHLDAAQLEQAEQACVACADLAARLGGSHLAAIHHLRGSIALRERRLDAALRHAQAAVAERDAEPAFHVTLAEIYRELRQPQNESLHLSRALEGLAADDTARPRIMLRLAGALLDANDAQQAERWYRRLLEIQPDNRDALLCLAVLREPTDFDEARALMGRHILLRADAAPRLRRALMLPAILQSNDEIDRLRERLDLELDEVLAGRWPRIQRPEYEVGATAFALAYHGRDDCGLLRKLARACRSVYPANLVCSRRPYAAGRRLRVGFVSTYFHSHSVARTTFGFSRDLRRDLFEVHVFAIAPKADDWAEAIRRSADHYIALPLDLDRVRETIEAAALDVLFFTDIGMDPLTYFLAFWRLAPIQLVSWGHPVTTGIDTIDYFVSADALEAQGSEAQYSERLIRLPRYFMPRYRRPVLDGPRKPRAELGLATGRHSYYCLQNLFKLHPDFDPALKGILERDPQGEIVLLESQSKGWMAQLRQRFERTLGAHAARVRFVARMPQQTFLQHIAAADVVLDPFHFGGGNSSCEPLSLGVPVATLPAFQLRGRFTLGMYEEMEIESCVAGTPEEFVDIAVRLARDAEYRQWVSGQIAARCERLFDRADAGSALGEELMRLAESMR